MHQYNTIFYTRFWFEFWTPYPKGTFYSVTGGQWIFVLDKSGKKAYRRKITIGRQNPQYYEVIEGLEPGEQVIVSGYEAYKDNDVLVFN